MNILKYALASSLLFGNPAQADESYLLKKLNESQTKLQQQITSYQQNPTHKNLKSLDKNSRDLTWKVLEAMPEISQKELNENLYLLQETEKLTEKSPIARHIRGREKEIIRNITLKKIVTSKHVVFLDNYRQDLVIPFGFEDYQTEIQNDEEPAKIIK